MTFEHWPRIIERYQTSGLFGIIHAVSDEVVHEQETGKTYKTIRLPGTRIYRNANTTRARFAQKKDSQ